MLVRVRETRNAQHELGSSKPREDRLAEDVVLAGRIAQVITMAFARRGRHEQAGDCPEKLVGCLVAESVVDLSELKDIDEERRTARRGAVCADEAGLSFEKGLQPGSVGKAGDKVMIGQFTYLGCRSLQAGDHRAHACAKLADFAGTIDRHLHIEMAL
jgi:hypothetical protein